MRLPWHPKYEGTCADTSDMTGWERFCLWIKWEARWTRRWAGDVSLWWFYDVRRHPKPPPSPPIDWAALLERQKNRRDET